MPATGKIAKALFLPKLTTSNFKKNESMRVAYINIFLLEVEEGCFTFLGR